MRALLVLIAVASVVLVSAACGEDFKDCYGDDLISCTCEGGALGYAKCGPSGDYKSSPCVCDGSTPGVDAGKSDAGDAGDASDAVCTRDGGVTDSGAFKQDFEPCAAADECDGCRCEPFQNTRLCTRSCASDAECAHGCNQRGVCRNP